MKLEEIAQMEEQLKQKQVMAAIKEIDELAEAYVRGSWDMGEAQKKEWKRLCGVYHFEIACQYKWFEKYQADEALMYAAGIERYLRVGEEVMLKAQKGEYIEPIAFEVYKHFKQKALAKLEEHVVEIMGRQGLKPEMIEPVHKALELLKKYCVEQKKEESPA